MQKQTKNRKLNRHIIGITLISTMLVGLFGATTITNATFTTVNRNLSIEPQTKERQPTLIWYRTWGGGAEDRACSVISESGYLYVAGFTHNSSGGGGDIVLLKYDTNGNQIWNKTWGGTSYDIAYGVTTESGYIYVAGQTGSYSPSGTRAFLLKYDTNGNLIWYKIWGGSSGNGARSVTGDNGFLYVAGFTHNSSGGGDDIVLLKYDTNGTLVWNKTWGRTPYDYAYGVTTYSGYIYVVGEIWISGAGGPDTVLLKYDTNGNLLWNRTWGGSEYDEGYSVTTYGEYLYVVGGTRRSGNYDAFLLKYDTSGNLLWNKTWGDNNYYERAYGVTTCNGYIYVSGETNGYGAYMDAFLLKYDTNGNIVWYEIWGGHSFDEKFRVTSEHGYLYLAGSTKSYGVGNFDMVLLKYSDPIPEYPMILLPIATTVLIALMMRKRLGRKLNRIE